MTEALKFATQAHSGQTRKSGDDYITHPVNVMNRMKSLGFDQEVLKAALLHDVCEDSDATKLDIEKTFGKRVGYMVDRLTKDPKEQYSDDEAGQNSRLQKYLKKIESAIKREPAVLFIKMCDQLDNLSSVPVFTEQKYYRKLWETKMYFIPLYQTASTQISRKLQGSFLKLLNELEVRINTLLEEGHQKAQESHDSQQVVEKVFDYLKNSKVDFDSK